MEIIVLFDSKVYKFFTALIDKLFYENYFSNEESAKKYVKRLINEVSRKIAFKKHFTTPSPLSHFGSKYVHISTNKNTTWYFLFEMSENRFLITHVFNNYSIEASLLNS